MMTPDERYRDTVAVIHLIRNLAIGWIILFVVVAIGIAILV